MRRRLTIFALLALLATTAAGAAQAEKVQKGDLLVNFNAGFAPSALPRHQAAPITVDIHGSIATTDGSHPPALSWLEVELNSNGRLTSAGLPVCSAPQLQSTSTAEARERCGGSLVGRGRFQATVLLGGEVPASGRILAFNSRLGGEPALLLHFFAQVPVRFTLVVPLRILRRTRGEFGTLLRTQVPKLAGGRGSITDIDLELGRRYTVGGHRRSYLSAACSAPSGFTEALFSFARARFRFEDHPGISSKLVDTCRVRSS